MMKNVELILRGPIAKYLLKHTLTIFIGLLAVTSLALIDLYFIGKLGPEEFAAVNFAAPVLLFGINLLLSVGAAAMIVVSKLVGTKNFEKVNRVGSGGIYLALSIGIGMMVLGHLGNDWIFRQLRATPDMIELLSGYMSLIYWSFLLMALMIVSTNIMRGFGDVKIPTFVMGIVVFFNLILDPLFIFGWGSIPAFGLKGAAMATLISVSIGLVVALINLSKYLTFRPTFLTYQWRDVLKIAVPITLSKTVLPITNGVITALLALHYGSFSVAAYGTGYRVDLFVLLFMMALSIVVAPFVGQNYGAGNFDRIKKCIRISLRFAVGYGIVAALAIVFGRAWIGGVFTEEQAIIEIISIYLLVVPLGYFLNGIFYIGTAVLDTLNQPTKSTMIAVFHLFGLYLPMAYLGHLWFGIYGVFAAFPVSSLIAAIIVLIVLKKTVKDAEQVSLFKAGSKEKILAQP